VTAPGNRRIVLTSLLVGIGLLAVSGFDHAATRRELLGLLGAQAASLRQIVAAAARSNVQAGKLAESQLSSRLLENARYLAELDGRGLLSDALLDEIVARHALFRVSVFGRGGQLERSAGPEGAGPPAGREERPGEPGGGPSGRGRGGEGRGVHAEGAGRGRGFGFGRAGGGAGGGQVLQRILEGGEAEAATDVHASRGRGGSRLAAGVRRAAGGAIVVTVDAQEVASMMRQASLDALLDDIVRSTPDVVYVIFEQPDARLVHGRAPVDAAEETTGAAPTEGTPVLERRQTEVEGRSVLEFSGPLDVGAAGPASLRLGMSLEGLRRAEWRMLAKGALTLAAAVTLAALGIGAAWLRRKYSLLSEEHARAEEALRRRDRLAAMGELASTVAHEVRNPLNAIAMSAQRLEREFLAQCSSDAAREELAELLAVVESEARRLDRTVQQFLDYARPPKLDPRPTALGGLLAAVAEAARPLAELRGVALEVDVARAGDAVVDPDQIKQVVDNLVRNALDAMPEGGRLRIAASVGADGATIEVADTGPGIPPEVQARIFDLYFTTKEDGTGIGLAVSQQIVTAHGGTIEVDSRPGAGTRMTVRLPGR
jgi:signal transduction histidine kinase